MVMIALMAWLHTTCLCTAVTKAHMYQNKPISSMLAVQQLHWQSEVVQQGLGSPFQLQGTHLMLMVCVMQGQQQLLAGGSHRGPASRQSAAGAHCGDCLRMASLPYPTR